MKFAYPLKMLAVICAATSAQLGSAGADVTVFAAASLRGALDEIAALSDTDITLSYGGSGTIARQVANGAPADVVILAHGRWMDWLADMGAILPESRANIGANTLVLIGEIGAEPVINATEIIERLSQNRLAMGQRDAVPAGIYAREWLENAGIWGQLNTQLAEVGNVRLALALVARGEAPLGVVYRSDARAEPRVDILYNVPETTHSKISYPAAATNARGNDFMTLLSSPQAIDILIGHGFSAPEVHN